MSIERIGIDTGGTFTDFVWINGSGSLELHKELSTPADPSQAVIKGIREMAVGKVVDVVHGSTVATNALLERKGPRTALITTAGFADVLAIGRQNRPDLYALVPQKPDPLVPRKWRFEVDERVNSSGDVVKPLNVKELRSIWERFAEENVESVAICLLFSFLRPEHEQQIASELRRLAADSQQESGPNREINLFLSLSSEVLPEFREYERTSTTVINAYVVPIMDRYLNRLSDGLSPRHLSVMQSNGGVANVGLASTQAARTVLSGPAGGVVGARYISSQADSPNIITFDMGGTSTDVALCEGQLPLTGEGQIAGQPLRLPMIDIHTVGAGGGSIARIDAGGALIVGPESAGADPGPACYPGQTARDGVTSADISLQKATTTDANLVLGRLDADHFLGGSMTLNLERAENAVGRVSVEEGSESVQTLAWNIVCVANATMERAIRKISVERGHDPRRFTLVAFGGAGPLHACDLATGLSIPKVIVPAAPGVLSALGMLAAPPTRDYSKTIMAKLDDRETIGTGWLRQQLSILRELAADEFVQESYDSGKLSFFHALDMRYVGQSHELRVNLGVNSTGIPLAQQFHEAHEKRYGYRQEGTQVEIVHLRLAAAAHVEKPTLQRLAVGGPDPDHAIVGQKSVWFEDGSADSVLYERSMFRAGNQFSGPAIIFQYDATTVVPPGWSAAVDQIGNLVLTARES